MRRAVIVANTPLPPSEATRPWLDRADLVIALDGAAGRLLDAGRPPDLVIGDLDSLTSAVRDRLPAERIRHDPDPERTDLEKAIRHAQATGHRDVTLLGGTDGRLDHTLANVSLLLHPWRPALTMRAVDHHFTAHVIRGRHTLRAPVGTLVSLWTPTIARGVTTRGLRWPLRDATLRTGARGVHNEVTRNPAGVHCRQGKLLVLEGHKVLPHA